MARSLAEPLWDLNDMGKLLDNPDGLTLDHVRRAHCAAALRMKMWCIIILATALPCDLQACRVSGAWVLKRSRSMLPP